jgi:hypothetical protein
MRLRNTPVLASAYFRRWLYLLCVGMWRGECAYKAMDVEGSIVELGTCKPTRGFPEPTRVFYSAPPK